MMTQTDTFTNVPSIPTPTPSAPGVYNPNDPNNWISQPRWDMYTNVPSGPGGPYPGPTYGQGTWTSTTDGNPRGTPGVDPDPGLTGEQRSAKAQIESTLAYYGLSSLAAWAWKEFLNNIPEEQIFMDIRQTPEYKARFPAMEALAKGGHAMSETQYINYEQSAMSIMQAAGLPKGFYDQPEDFTQFLTNNIALPELQSRIDVAKVAVYNSDPATLAALRDYYGIQGGGNHIGDATAYFLDPTRALPAIQQQMVAAQEAGAATRSGYQGLLQTDAENLARLGIDPTAAQKGFGTLANLAPVFSHLPGEAGDLPTREQGLAATFYDNAQAANAIEAQVNKRKAVFDQGGGFSQTQGGMTGI